MKNKNIILIISVVFLTAVGWFVLRPFRADSAQQVQKDIYHCPMHTSYTSDHPGNCPICGMKLVKKEQKILYWTDPMIPGYKAQGPGKSPMGMDLVPVYDAADSTGQYSQGHSTISVDTQKQQLIGMKTAPAQKKTLTRTIHTYGYVAHDLPLYEAQFAYMKAWRAYYFFPGVKNVDTQRDLIKAEYELRHYGLTDSQLEELQKVKYWQLTKTSSDLLFFAKGTWVYTQINENDLRYIDVGQKVTVSIPAYNETTEGIVRGVSLIVDPVTHTTLVRIELPQYKGELKMNMYVNVDFPVEMDEGVVVPRDAIMDTGLEKVVFVQVKEGIFEPRRIQTGFEGDGMVAVKSGLKEGETIVVSGNFLLDSESRLQGAWTGGQ